MDDNHSLYRAYIEVMLLSYRGVLGFNGGRLGLV